jgi:fatty acid synthase
VLGFQEVRRVQPHGPYHVVGYSFGACIAFEMALQLQAAVKEEVKLSLLDGSHAYVAAHTEQRRGTKDEDEAAALCAFVLQFGAVVAEDYKELHARFLAQPTFDARLRCVDEILRATGRFPAEGCEITKAAENFYQKLMIAALYQPAGELKSDCDVTLVKAENATTEALKLGDDYGLGKVVEGKVKVVSVSGDHTSFIQGDNARSVAAILEGKSQ